MNHLLFRNTVELFEKQIRKNTVCFYLCDRNSFLITLYLKSVEKLGAVRIGHGYRCLEDELLYQDLLKKRVHFEVCPLSSLMTNGAPNGKNHPILR